MMSRKLIQVEFEALFWPLQLSSHQEMHRSSLHARSSLIQYTFQRQFLQNCEFPVRKHCECKQFRCVDLFRRMMHYHDSNVPAPKEPSQQTWQDIVGQRQAAFRPLWAALEKTKDGPKGQQIHTWPGRGIIGYDW